MFDARRYIEYNGYEVDVDGDLSFSGGVYMEGPDMGEVVMLPAWLSQQLELEHDLMKGAYLEGLEEM